MVLTLRELLERIRPAGTPGAPTEGERERRRDDRAAELADMTVVLAEFEAEADAVIAAAELDAQRHHERARQQARQIAATLPDRVATSSADIAAHEDLQREAEEVAIRSDAAHESALLMSRAEETVPALAEAAVQVIWDSVTTVTEHAR